MTLELNKIYNEDCLVGLEKVDKVDLIVIDPPYGMDYQSNFRKEKFDGIKNDDKSYKDLLINVFSKVNEKLIDGGHIYCFCSWHNVDVFKAEFEKIFELKNILIWEKDGGFIGDLDCQYGVNYEFILFGYKRWYEIQNNKKDYLGNYKEVKDVIKRNFERVGLTWKDPSLVKLLVDEGICKNPQSARVVLKHKFDFTYRQFELLTEKQFNLMNSFMNWDFKYEDIKKLYKSENKRIKLNGKREGAILKFGKENPNKYIHPTQKPVSLIEYIVKKSSNENGVIMDCFMGSGTTAIATLNVGGGRKYIGFELDEGYYNKALERIELHKKEIS